MRMNQAQTLSVVEQAHDHATDQGQTYYDAIVNFLGAKESKPMELSGCFATIRIPHLRQ